MVVPYLFDKRKFCMLIEVMSRERKMVVERSTTGVFYIMAMRVDSQVSWWFTFTDILDITA